MSQTIDNTTSTATIDNTINDDKSIMHWEWINIVPLVLVFTVVYFLLIRPQEKKRKEHEQLIRTLKKGEQIITTSGIYAVIINVDENNDTVLLEIAPNTRIKVLRAAIANVINGKTSSKGNK
ncbi:preprotein translocase, YajC subunit [Orientia chuto str. Dubai]|uniref:Sec translocon accessory complex subunit YajC n=1 Tax=Orientia chuto str. Dubai TaxID=1359168 RepID=A0A0F3MKG1_9RICK|nr:preprotein translocase subunit YajC [Candidatus Orientia mediorientalis]KJV56273.1 preprotein translocase, YajC subunit [Orientia chuto str. Dubai]